MLYFFRIRDYPHEKSKPVQRQGRKAVGPKDLRIQGSQLPLHITSHGCILRICDFWQLIRFCCLFYFLEWGKN